MYEKQKEPGYEKTREIDIGRFLKTVWTHKWAVAAMSLALAAITAFISVYMIRPLYRAEFTVFINNRSTNSETQLVSNGDTIAAQSLAYTYSALITNRAVLEPAAEKASVSLPYAELKKMVTTDIEENTQLIDVRITGPSPEECLAFAQEIADIAPGYVEGIVEGTSMKIVSAPVAAGTPVSPNIWKNTVLGLLAGFVSAVALIFLYSLFDTKIGDIRELEDACGIASVGTVPQIRTEKREKGGRRAKEEGGGQMYDTSVLDDGTSWETKEAYRSLRTNVSFMINGKDRKVIGVTSAMPEEGKTTNAVNHAVSFAQIGKKVLLIDADMRRPSVTSKLGIKNGYGLSNYLAGQKSLNECIKENKRYGIDIMPSGAVPPDPTWLLQSERFGELIGAVKEAYDYVIIDLPPVTTVADAYIIAEHIDGYLLVVRSGKTDRRAVEDMLEQLRMADADIIGFINNDVRRRGSGYYRFGYYKSGYYR